MDNKEEFILYQEGGDNNPSNKEEESESNNEEYITNEEFLLECARFNDLPALKNALNTSITNLNQNYQDFRGNTALHMASANGHVDMVKFLINELKCDINIINNSGSSALSWAALNGQKEVVSILIKNGANVNTKNNLGKTPSEEAYDSGFYDISEMLVAEELKTNKGIFEESADE